MGMTAHEYWEEDCHLVVGYRKAYEIKQEEIDRLRGIIKQALEILSYSEVKGSLLMCLEQVEFILRKAEKDDKNI